MTTALRTARLVGLVLLAAAGWLLWPATVGVHHLRGDARDQHCSRASPPVTWPCSGQRATGSATSSPTADPTLGTTVMHRIVAVDGEAFVTQGDNNPGRTPTTPPPPNIKGRLWLRVPQGGAALQLRSPGRWRCSAWPGPPSSGCSAPAAAATGVVAGAPHPLVAPPHCPPPASARRPGPRPPGRARLRRRRAARRRRRGLLLALPATQTDTRTVVVAQQVHWDWSGTAVAGATYPTGHVTTGDAVYTRLAGPVTVSLSDTVGGTGLTALTGTVRLVLGVQSADGWRADVVTGAPAAPAGGKLTASVVLDTTAAAELVHRHLAEVGGSAGGATLTVTPQVALTGTVGGRPFTAGTVPALTFTMDGTALRAGGGPSALSATVPTAVTADVVGPRTVEAGPVWVPLDTAGIAVGVLAVVAVVAAGACALAGRPGPAGRRTTQRCARRAGCCRSGGSPPAARWSTSRTAPRCCASPSGWTCSCCTPPPTGPVRSSPCRTATRPTAGPPGADEAPAAERTLRVVAPVA